MSRPVQRTRAQDRVHSRDEAAALLQRMAQARDCASVAEFERLRNRVVAAYLPFATKTASRFARGSLPFDDLVQEAAMGLSRACDRFEPQRGIAFQTFAVWWCRAAMQQALRCQSHCLRLPAGLSHERSKCRQVTTQFEREKGRPPTLAELARGTGLSTRRVERACSTILAPLSMDAAPGPAAEGSETTLHDVMPAPGPSPLEVLMHRELQGVWEVSLASLKPRERAVIQARSRGATLDAVGKSIAGLVGEASRPLSREMVRRIEARAIEKLRSSIERTQRGGFVRVLTDKPAPMARRPVAQRPPFGVSMMRSRPI
jgi:RNA polymerase sigma factor (sigma-70 family)